MKNIGVMRVRLTLQQESLAPDTGGGNSLSWSNIGIYWAELAPLSGREDVQGEKLTGRLTHRISMRAEVAVTTAMRFLYGVRTFNIRSVKNVEERGRFLDILAEEGAAI